MDSGHFGSVEDIFDFGFLISDFGFRTCPPVSSLDLGGFVCGQADCGLRIADCGLRISDCGMRIAECGMRNADCGMRIVDCGMRSKF